MRRKGGRKQKRSNSRRQGMLQGPRAAAAAANGGHRWSPMSPAWTRSPSPGCRWTPLASRYWNAVVGHRASRAPCRRLRSAMDGNQSGFRTSGESEGDGRGLAGSAVGVVKVNWEERCALLHGATMLDGLVFAHRQAPGQARHTDSGIPGHTGASVGTGSLHPVLCLGAR